jgi:hypothetical protein
MARLAHKMGARWVANVDADEFWFGIKNVYDLKDKVSVVRLPPNYDFLPLQTFSRCKFDRQLMPFWTRSKESLRLMHRSFSDVVVSDGNHNVYNCPGETVYSDKIILKHYSIRSYEQFEQKVINGGTALKKSPQGLGQSTHWRYWYKLYNENKLKSYYHNEICIDDKLDKMKCRILL